MSSSALGRRDLALFVLEGGAVVAQASSPSSLREAYTLAVSFGGAFGGTRALELGWLGPAPDFLLGAAVGALLFACAVGVLARVPALSGVLVGAAMFAMGILALLAAVAAKGDAWGVRPVVRPKRLRLPSDVMAS